MAKQGRFYFQYAARQEEVTQLSQQGGTSPNRFNCCGGPPSVLTHAGIARAYCLARFWYSPLRVSIRRTSPISMNKGTLTTAPELSVAGLVPPWAVSPLR